MSIIEKFKLTGQKAYVTGGARGIGKSIATALAEVGADVAIVDLDVEEAKKTVASIKQATGTHPIAIEADVTSPEDVERMIGEIVGEFGRIDIAFNNAGICINAPAEEMTFT